MKYNILAVCFMILHTINAQSDLDIFKDFTPKWIHSTIDSSAWDLPGYREGNPNMFFRQSLVNNGFIYNLYEHNWLNYYADGAILEKINLENGDLSWSTGYDLRSIEVNEKPDNMRINSKGELEIAGERFLYRKEGDYGTVYNTLVRRKYDTVDGDLIDYYFADPTDTLSCKIEPSYAHNLFFLSDSTYQYFYSFFSYDQGKFIVNSQMDSLGRQKMETVTDYDTLNTNLYTAMVPEEFSLVNADTFVAALYVLNEEIEWEMPVDFNLYIKLYDRQLNEIKSIDLSNKFRHARDDFYFNMVYADDKMIVVRFFNRLTTKPPDYPVYYTYKDFIFDYEGNTLDSIDLVENNLTISSLFRFSEDEFLLVGSGLQNHSSAPLNIFKKKIGQPMHLLKTIHVKENYKYALPDGLKVLSNNEILMNGTYSHWNSKYGFIQDDFPITILFSREDVDITSGLKEEEDIMPANLSLSPNPTSDYFTISCEETGNKNVEVLDHLGRLVLRQSIEECGESQMDISALNSGLYLVRMIDDEGRRVGTGKIVKN